MHIIHNPYYLYRSLDFLLISSRCNFLDRNQEVRHQSQEQNWIIGQRQAQTWWWRQEDIRRQGISKAEVGIVRRRPKFLKWIAGIVKMKSLPMVFIFASKIDLDKVYCL